MKITSRVSSIVIAMVFIVSISVYGALNLKTFANAVKNTSPCLEVGLQTKTREIERAFTTSLMFRDQFVDVYGFVQKELRRSLIGNFEFMKSNNEFIHMAVNNINIRPLVDSMLRLKNTLDKSDIPLIYVQIPPRSTVNTEINVMNISYGEDVAISDAKTELSSYGITYLDIADKMVGYLPPEKLFFKTDVHLSTEGEFFVAKEIIRILKQQGLSFEQSYVNQILDLSNYIVDSRLFLGNLSRSTGKYFSELDVFDNYTPKFQNSVSMINRVTGERQDGDFEDIFMNNYKDKPDITERTYWITNYLHFGQSCYEFINHNQERNKLLVICDSMGMRIVPLLSLLTNKVTIVDIRYQGLNSYVTNVLNAEKYDAVIVLHENTLFPYEIN